MSLSGVAPAPHVQTRPIGLTIGDPCGIGIELALRAWQLRATERIPPFMLIGPLQWVEPVRQLLSPQIKLQPCQPDEAWHVFDQALPIFAIDTDGDGAPTPGQPDSRFATGIIRAIETGVELCARNEIRALTTNPIAKHVLYEAGFTHPGHTEFLGVCARRHDIWRDQPIDPVMMLIAQDLRVALATIHLPLSQVSSTLFDGEDPMSALMAIAQICLYALQRDFGLGKPRLTLAALNPHAGENGALGREEQDWINPVAQRLRTLGHDVSDAQSADSLFHEQRRRQYDAVLAMYHDQGLIPVKMLDFWGGVNLTLGLPFTRSSPDHGTGFDIAGQGIARPDSLIAALKLAASCADHRQIFDAKPPTNPKNCA